MELLLICLAIILGSLGLCAMIMTVGYWATYKTRREHDQKMFALHEQAKVNAITIQEQDLALQERRLNMIQLGSGQSIHV